MFSLRPVLNASLGHLVFFVPSASVIVAQQQDDVITFTTCSNTTTTVCRCRVRQHSIVFQFTPDPEINVAISVGLERVHTHCGHSYHDTGVTMLMWYSWFFVVHKHVL